MPIYRGSQKITAVYRGGQSVKRVYRGNTEVWSAREVVQIQLGDPNISQNAQAQSAFREALVNRGYNYTTITELPFDIKFVGSGSAWGLFDDCYALKRVENLDTSNVTVFHVMFRNCLSLEYVADLDATNVTNARYMLENTVSLADGSIRLLNRNPGVDSTGMINGSALTREPWYLPDGSLFSYYSDADYYYPLTGMSLQNEGLKSTPLTSQSGALADRGNHAWLAKSRPRINVTESWSSGWSASAWFEQAGTHAESTAYLFSRGDSATGTAIFICTQSGTPHRLLWRPDDGSTLLNWTSEDRLLPTSGWFHFAVTAEYVSPNYRLRFFVNGTMVRASTLNSRLNNLVFATNDWVSFGNTSSGSAFPYEGNIDDMAMWSRKLTDEEVASVYVEGRSN